jgi:hypothetical protein
VNRIRKAMKIAMVAVVLLASGIVTAQEASVPVTLGWSPCPARDGDGWPLALAVGYDVYVQRGGGDEEYLATVMHDTTYVLDAERGVVQRIRVYGFDADGNHSPASEWSDPIYFEPEQAPRGPDQLPPPVPELRPNYPNPFNPETRLVYGVPDGTPSETRVALEIYNLRGHRVRTFEIEALPGWHEEVWDGRDDRGQIQATGTYIMRYICGDRVEVGKLTMVK